MMISILCPAYNEAEGLPKLIKAIHHEINHEDHEIIIVDDGSQDHTVVVLQQLRQEYPHLKYISFNRNFGHQHALMTGIQHASGNFLIMLDADLQHPPSIIPSMIEKWKEGHKIVQCLRVDDKNDFKTITSKAFYRLISKISDTTIPFGTSDFRLLDQEVIKHLKALPQPVFLRGYLPWSGYSTAHLLYTPQEREMGSSKYTLRKMIRLSIDGITSQSTLPLKISRYVGSLISLLSFLYALYALCIYFFTDQSVTGWTSLLISVLFLGGIQLIGIGILGEYIGRIFEKSLDKPNYIINHKEGFNESK